MADLYYDCSKTDLELIDSLDQPDMSYEFHILAAWRDKTTGEIFWSEDSGCSCPSPFEDCYYRGPEDTNLNRSMSELRDAIDNFPVNGTEKRAFRKSCGI